MTVSYQYDVASSTSGGFTRLLFKWQGSVYKLIYNELLLFGVCYSIMSAIYRYVFNEHQKRVFEHVAFYCDTYMNYIPLSFILGFYVSFVASRWWQQYMSIPWPDRILHAIALHVTGFDEKGRMLRRSLVRYLNLSLVLVLRSISSAVKKRFPTVDHLIEAGFMTAEELDLFNMVPNLEFNTYWIPCTWFTALIRDAKSQKRLRDPSGVKLIMEEFSDFRQKCGMLWSYDWVSIPLVYTQMLNSILILEPSLECLRYMVVTIATYSFFMAAVVGRQYVEKSPIPYKKMIDLYVPFFTLLQFFFYMGLLKVAEQLINPFGDDDEDFELNWIIDRHMKVSYLIVDTLIHRCPPLTKDIFFDEECPVLPYTEASAVFKKKTYRGSVANMVVPGEQQNLILPDIQEEAEESDTDSRRFDSISPRANSMSRLYVDAANGSDGCNLSVPEFCTNSSSPSSAISSRGNSFSRSATLSKSQSRRQGTAGSKGISNALMVLGSNQAVMGADSSSIGENGVDDGGLVRKKSGPRYKREEDPDYLFFPFNDVCLDIEGLNFDTSTDSWKRIREKSLAWMPASLQAKIAMRKKPVIKWKPYRRPITRTNTLSDLGVVPSGEFEEQCAFMWKTIDDESESIRMSVSNMTLNEDPRSYSTGAAIIDSKGLSHYREVKPRSMSRDTDDTIIESQLNLPKYLAKQLDEKMRLKRNRYKIRGRTRKYLYPHYYSSLPYIPVCKCGQKAFSPRFLKSLSEASIFLETISRLKRKDAIVHVSSEAARPPAATSQLQPRRAGATGPNQPPTNQRTNSTRNSRHSK